MRFRLIYRIIQFLARLQVRLYALAGDAVWRSHDGRVTRISQMSDRHLENCVRMLYRNGDYDHPVARIMIHELARRDAQTYNPLGIL